MIKTIFPMPFTNEWCEVCKKKCDGIRMPFLLSSNESNKSLVICNCCIDMALNEKEMLPEDF